MDIQFLKKCLETGDPAFESELAAKTREAKDFAETLQLCTLRKRAVSKGLTTRQENVRRVAVIGGANLRPMVDFIEHFASVIHGVQCDLWVGDYDNYHAEIMDTDSQLYAFRPDSVLLLPSERRCVFEGGLASSLAEQKEAAERVVEELLGLCGKVHDSCGAEIILGNFRLPPYFDPGPMRSSSLASDYSFRKLVNMELGLKLPSFVHICDIEFLSNRRGTLVGVDDRTWFESKQPFSACLIPDVAREYAHVLCSVDVPPKKVVVLDLDNTLWGGVIGDDGLEGIELGTTSPRGEAFRDFQKYLLQLTRRGVLLAVCSKNDYANAIEPFEKHPEMVLRTKDIVCFKANWEPKSENIRQIASELNLGLDSIVFVDDNRAEIEIVNQFLPEVSAIWVGDDPSDFATKLKDSRYFEFRNITLEDVQRVQQYKQESKRQHLLSSSTDMGSYLKSLEMVGTIKRFERIDVPRITQLINKSNQFNLTTRRRTEAEVAAIVDDKQYSAFTVRLADRFGDHGLIAIVIGNIIDHSYEIDTWLMSCRVLKRQVEEEVLNEIVRLAKAHGCTKVVGRYIPTVKNNMVQDLYPKMGFLHAGHVKSAQIYELNVEEYQPISTQISQEIYAAAGNIG